MKKTVLAFGEILWDLLPGETVLGGAPFNFICRAGMLGDDGFMVSRLGRDDPGREAFDRIGELGLDGSEEVTLAALDHGVIRKLDLGRANGRCFIAIVGVGFDAEVVQRINRFRTGHITHRDYLWPICRTFWEHRFPTLNIVADGRRICDQPALLFVSNISRYAVGRKITPHADFSSSYLDVTVYKCHKRRQLLLHSALTILGQSHRSPDVIRTRCRRLIVNCADLQVPVQLDGDPGPKLPLEINVLPSTARVLAPPPPDHPHHCPPARLYRLRRSLVR